MVGARTRKVPQVSQVCVHMMVHIPQKLHREFLESRLYPPARGALNAPFHALKHGSFPQRVDRSLVGVSDEASGELIPDCELPPVAYDDSPLDKALLFIFRKLVASITGFTSPKQVRVRFHIFSEQSIWSFSGSKHIPLHCHMP